MKNKDTENMYFETRVSGIHEWLIKAAIAIFTVILSVCVLHAQDNKNVWNVGVGSEIMRSGNGHGAFLSPYITIVKNDHSFILSPLLLKADRNFYGGKIAHSLNLSNNIRYQEESAEFDALQISIFSYFQFVGNCKASDKALRYESRKRRDGSSVSESIMNTAEAGGGLELRINLSRSVCIRNCIGLSVYRHFGNMDLVFHDRSAANLNLSTGLQVLLR